MDRHLHLVGITDDGCRIARDDQAGYVVTHGNAEGPLQRVANLPSAYAVCELFRNRDLQVMPRRR